MEFFKSLMANVEHTSEGGKLDSKDAFAVGRQAVFVGLGAMVAFLANNLGGLDLGPYTVLIVPVVAAGLSTVQKWIASNQAIDK